MDLGCIFLFLSPTLPFLLQPVHGNITFIVTRKLYNLNAGLNNLFAKQVGISDESKPRQGKHQTLPSQEKTDKKNAYRCISSETSVN